ncbi:putative ABC transporter permease [Enterococcus thailandicus]|uniref:putative ABC transporter permease n=1 Tax=Enterococcus thailandicus TaxID=417368 RepID=UPI0022EBF462|nr:putative ABC transporter permease [Enterococcus thailandicus]MDA3973965.1 putative ABC transporter permease [Enterococcus thailandicus]MDA3976225.1 putative ABC transporter permease [Enterococcus thailandicus]MDA3981190.1 putative ABC transporter permease [Enterococcus thailandicus]
MTEFIRVVLLFFIYSFVGWLWETVYCSIKAKHFVYRGFLVGPITPIYGFGILGVLYFIEPFQSNLVLLYVLSTILVTILEYLTSFGLEKLFHATWWDYHDVPLNINGRVALPVSLFWGVGCVLIVKVIHPHILILERFLAEHFSFYLPVILIGLIMMDLGYTLANLQSFQKAVTDLQKAINEQKANLQEVFEKTKDEWEERQKTSGTVFGKGIVSKPEKKAAGDWLQAFKESTKTNDYLPRLNYTQRRFLKNFPQLSLKEGKDVNEIRQLVKELRKKK